jgi:hypothetical protein
MPLARFHMYAQGVDLWVAPTLALGDGWIATMRHIARENRMFVIGVNPVLHIDHIPAGFPHRDRLAFRPLALVRPPARNSLRAGNVPIRPGRASGALRRGCGGLATATRCQLQR